MTVSRETEKLEAYAGLVRKWNPAINLVASSTLVALEERHISDCVQLCNLSAQLDGKWVDLGSGGGLPGLVVAICRPEVSVTLIESDKRKASFLRNAARELSLPNATILTQRIEAVDPLESDILSARALAPLPLLLSYASRHLANTGRAFLMKGRNWKAEVDEASENWCFDLISHPSKTDPDAAILEISALRHA